MTTAKERDYEEDKRHFNSPAKSNLQSQPVALEHSGGIDLKSPSLRRIRNDTLGISRADCGSWAVLHKTPLTHEAHQQ